MEIEEEFKRLNDFLIRNKERQFVGELMNIIHQSEISFQPGESSLAKKHLIDIYSTRREIQNEINKNEFVEGYDEVLFNLEHAHANEFTITGIHSAHGAYLIFSDLERNNLIGVLKSKRTLTEIRKRYSDHEALVGHEALKYRRTENVFIRGELKN